MDTATEITEGHYQRPEVKEVILKLCSYAGGLRGLNGDEGWYSKGPGGSVKLRGPGDYDDTTARARSLYMTADVFDPKVFDLSAQWIEGRGGEGRGRVTMEPTTRRIVMALCHVIAEADEWEDIAVASRALAKFVEVERLETEYRHMYWSGVREPGAGGPDGGDGGGRFGRIW